MRETCVHTGPQQFIGAGASAGLVPTEVLDQAPEDAQGQLKFGEGSKVICIFFDCMGVGTPKPRYSKVNHMTQGSFHKPHRTFWKSPGQAYAGAGSLQEASGEGTGGINNGAGAGPG